MDLFAATKNAHRAMELFGEISAIPRASGDEKAIADYIETFGKTQGLFTYRDNANNVFLRYTPEKPIGKPILLQGHTDMVCVKVTGSTHDFATDPLELFLDEDGWLGAKGTSLGGDDGIAVAMMLAILEQKWDREIECLFTSSEETGMDGAIAFDYSMIHAETMINLDSENEEEATVSCAGGIGFSVEREYMPASCNGNALTVTLDGFAGGHSGAEIHLGHVNAARQLAKILERICEKYDCRLIAFRGGEKHNSIPMFAEATVLVGGEAEAEILQLFKRAKKNYTKADAQAEVKLSRAPYSGNGFDMNSTKQIFRMIAKTRNGVVSVYEDMDLVKTSLNMGIAEAKEGRFTAEISMRSSSEAELAALADAVRADLEKFGATCRSHGSYPAWEYAEKSPLRDLYVRKCREIYGKEVRVGGIHAGLECGFVRAARPEMDMISVGPNMRNIHTVTERLELASCERFWNLLTTVLHEEF